MARIASLSATVSSRSSNAASALSGRNSGERHPVCHFRVQFNRRFHSIPSILLPSSERGGIGTLSSSSLRSSYVHLDCAQSIHQYHQQRRRPQLQTQLRSLSSDIEDHTNGKNDDNKENRNKSIATHANDVMTLQKVAFAAKQIVELGVVQSIEMGVWKSSNTKERKKGCRFFFPQLRKAADDLLCVTRDVDLLSALIKNARQNKGCNTTGEIPVRELHSSFLHLTQIVLENFDVAMESERDQYDGDGQENSVYSFKLLELVLALSCRAHELGLGYHLPLYQRLALLVAKHPKVIDEKTPRADTTKLGPFAILSRAEWIQTIHRWSRSTWCSNNKGSQNQSNEKEGQLVLKSKHDDLKWFHPCLKVLAADGRWSCVYQILFGLLQPNLDPIVVGDDYDDGSMDGKEDNFRVDFDDPVALSSATSFPHLDEDLVFDLLVPMNQQRLLRNLWDERGRYLPSESIEKGVIAMMEASIWKIFETIPSHLKATIRYEDEDCSEKYSLQDAIGILLKCGPLHLNDGNMDDFGRDYFSDDDEEDSLANALRELEDLLDEHLDIGHDGEGEKDEINEPASDAIVLATLFSNQIRHENNQDNRKRKARNFNSLIAPKITMPSDKTEVRVDRSHSDHVMEIPSRDKAPHQSTESILDNEEEDEYLDWLYDDRAADYEDNVPDVLKQIYQNNGNQQLRYSSSLEYQIYEGMQLTTLHYDSEDDDEF